MTLFARVDVDGHTYEANLSQAPRVPEADSPGWLCYWATLKRPADVAGRPYALNMHVWRKPIGEPASGDEFVTVMVSHGAWSATQPFPGDLYYTNLRLELVDDPERVFVKDIEDEGIHVVTEDLAPYGRVAFLAPPNDWTQTRHYFPARFHFTRSFAVCKKMLAPRVARVLANPQPLENVRIGPLMAPTLSASPEQDRFAKGEIAKLRVMRMNGDRSPFAGTGNLYNAGQADGSRLEQCPGALRSQTWAKLYQMRADHNGERMPLACFDLETGRLVGRAQLGTDFEYYLDRQGGPEQRLAYFENYLPPSEPDCVYRTDLVRTVAHDEYHLGRGIVDDIAAYEHLRRPEAGWRLQIYANDARISLSLEGPRGTPTDNAFGRSLFNDKILAERYPHTGGRIQRAEWVSMLQAYALHLEPRNAAEIADWCEAKLAILERWQTPLGLGANAPFGYSIDQDEPWTVWGMDKRRTEAPPWQWGLVWLPAVAAMGWALARRGGAQSAHPTARRILTKAGVLWDKLGERTVQGEEGGRGAGLNRYVVGGDVGGEMYAGFNGGVGPARFYYDHHAMACVFMASYRETDVPMWVIDAMCSVGHNAKPGRPMTRVQLLAELAGGDPFFTSYAAEVVRTHGFPKRAKLTYSGNPPPPDLAV